MSTHSKASSADSDDVGPKRSARSIHRPPPRLDLCGDRHQLHVAGDPSGRSRRNFARPAGRRVSPGSPHCQGKFGNSFEHGGEDLGQPILIAGIPAGAAKQALHFAPSLTTEIIDLQRA
jgi:hypothetical protein